MKASVIILLLFVLSCDSASDNNAAPQLTNAVFVNSDLNLRKVAFSTKRTSEMSNQELWSYLAFEQNGCLMGLQYQKSHVINGEHIMARSSAWQAFFKREKRYLTHVLLSKLAHTDTTVVHTCPYQLATEGELAVYALQKIHYKNWWDFEEFQTYTNDPPYSSADNPQVWLRSILENEIARNKMIDCWEKEAS